MAKQPDITKGLQVRVSKEWAAEAAHSLPNHDGKCRNLHGHSYRIIVELIGPVKNTLTNEDPDQGMVMDFTQVGVLVEPLIKQIDHQHLNTFLTCPTAERLATWIAIQLHEAGIPCRSLKDPDVDHFTQHVVRNDEVRLASVKIYETAKCFAEIRFE